MHSFVYGRFAYTDVVSYPDPPMWEGLGMRLLHMSSDRCGESLYVYVKVQLCARSISMYVLDMYLALYVSNWIDVIHLSIVGYAVCFLLCHRLNVLTTVACL